MLNSLKMIKVDGNTSKLGLLMDCVQKYNSNISASVGFITWIVY
jgi:hypothetical protein